MSTVRTALRLFRSRCLQVFRGACYTLCVSGIEHDYAKRGIAASRLIRPRVFAVTCHHSGVWQWLTLPKTMPPICVAPKAIPEISLRHSLHVSQPIYMRHQDERTLSASFVTLAFSSGTNRDGSHEFRAKPKNVVTAAL